MRSEPGRSGAIRALRRVLCPIAAASVLAASPADANSAGHLSAPRARLAVTHYARAVVRSGDATSFRVGKCGRASPREVRCGVTFYGFEQVVIPEAGPATYQNAADARLCGRRIHVALDAVIDDDPYSEPA